MAADVWHALRAPARRMMGFLALDAKRSITDLDPQLAPLLNCTAQDLLGRSLDSFIDPKDRSGHADYIDAIAAGTTESMRIRASLRIEAARSHVWLTMTRLTDGWSVMVTPIIEGDAEHKLIASRERWRALIRTANEGVAVLDANAAIIEHNPCFLTLMHFRSRHGVALNESAVAHRSIHELIGPSAFDEVLAPLAETRPRRRRFEGQIAHRGRDLVATLTPMMPPGMGYLGSCLVIRDITDELNLQRAQLDRARAVGRAELAIGVLHDVGNVLNSVTTSSDLLRSSHASAPLGLFNKVVNLLTDHEDDLVDFLVNDSRGKSIISALDRVRDALNANQLQVGNEIVCLNEKVGQLREVVASQRLEAAPTEFREAVRPSELIDAAIDERVAASTAELIQVVDDDRSVHVDRAKVVRILRELINNAHTAIDGQGTINVSAHRDGADIVFEVSDDGVGFSPEVGKLIFTSGFSTTPGNHGFGLHQMSNAATELGGSLAARSGGTGMGAQFTLRVTVGEAPRSDYADRPASAHAMA